MTQVLERLAYVLRANTEGLASDLQGAERHLDKFTAFVERNPLMAAGALGAALLGVGTKAVAMAAEVEKATKRIERIVPGAAGQLGKLRESIEELSRSTPRSQAELAQAADQIARGGVESMAGLEQRLTAVARAADATGEDMQGILGGLDQALDLFGLSSAESEQVLAKLFATAKGKAPLEDLFAALQGAAPTIRNLGLDFDTTVGALTGLLEEGLKAKQAGAELKAYGELGAEGAAEIRKLAAAFGPANTAMAEFDAAVRKSRESSEASWQLIKNNFSAAMIDLGERVLPIVNSQLRDVVDLMDHMSGAQRKLTSQGDLEALRLGASATGRRGASTRGLAATAQQLNRDARAGLLDLSDRSLEDLARMQLTLMRIRTETGASATAFFHLEQAIAKAQKAATKLAVSSPTTPGAGSGAPGPLSAEEIKRRQEAAEAAAKKLHDLAKANIKAVDQIFEEQWDAEEKAAKKQTELREDVSREFKQWSVQQSTTLIDDLALDFAERIESAEKAGLKDIADAWRKARDQALAYQRAVESNPFGEWERANAADANVVWDEREDTIGQMARSMADTVAGAIALGNALGIVDDRALRIAQGLSAVGSHLKSALTGDFGSIVQVVGGFAQAIRGAFGQSESARENARSARAIERLADRLGDLLEANLSGRQVGNIGRATADYVAAVEAARRRRFEAGIGPGSVNARDFYESLGIPFDEVQRLAASLGVTLNGTAESFRHLQDAIEQADWAAFLDTFAGQLDLLEERFGIYGITSDVEKFQKTLALLMDPELGAPALFGLLGGLDLSSAEGKEAARTLLQQLFERAAADDLTSDELGGLDPRQFVEVIKRLLGYLGVENAGGAAVDPQNLGVVSGFRGLTEAAGNRLADYVRAQVDLLTQILAELRAYRVPLLLPPALTAGATAAVGGAGVSVTIHFTQQNFGAADVPTVGRAAQDGIALALDAGLTHAGLTRQMRARGDLRALP